MTPTTTLILDGIWSRPARFGKLRRVLEADCGPTEIFHYNTSGCVPFEILARQLCERIRQFDQPINLLGFSMGGIVIRTAHLLDPSLPIRRAVFLNTPHEGTVMSYLLPLKGTRELQPTSALMKKLAADNWNIPTLVTWCPFDTIIVPGRSANWAKAAQSIRSAPLFHNWPIWSGRIHRKIAGFLSQDVVAGSREQCVTRVCGEPKNALTPALSRSTGRGSREGSRHTSGTSREHSHRVAKLNSALRT